MATVAYSWQPYKIRVSVDLKYGSLRHLEPSVPVTDLQRKCKKNYLHISSIPGLIYSLFLKYWQIFCPSCKFLRLVNWWVGNENDKGNRSFYFPVTFYPPHIPRGLPPAVLIWATQPNIAVSSLLCLMNYITRLFHLVLWLSEWDINIPAYITNCRSEGI
jgi:hypothetical protein